MSTIIDSNSLPLQEDPNFISPPYLKGALYHGARSITVYGSVLGATIDIEIDGVLSSSITDNNLPHPDGVLIQLPTKLVVNQNVRVRQKRTDEAKSEWSSEFNKVIDVKKDYPIVLPRPKVSALLYECGSRTFVSNLVQGGTVRILSEEDEKIIGAYIGCKESQSIDIFPSFIQNQKIRAESGIIGATGYDSVERNVESIQSQTIKQPTISPIYEGAKYVLVEDVLNGADLHLSRESFGNISVFKSGSDKCFIPVEIPFQAGEKIAVWQSICSENFASSSKSVTLVNDHSLLPAPEVGPIQVGDNSILVTNFVYGATLVAYVNHIQAGRGGGPKIPLSKNIECGDIIHVQQVLVNFKSNKVIQIKPLCVNPPMGEDLAELDFYPVGTSYFFKYYNGSGSDSFVAESEEPTGIIYYPAEQDGTNKPFNKALASRGPVPIVFIAHGLGQSITSYQGFEYFQKHLAKIGIVSISIRFTDKFVGYSNIEHRADQLLNAVIHVDALNGNPNSRFFEKIDFKRMGFLGHSRGGEAVILAANSMVDGYFLPDAPHLYKIKGIVSLAPTQGAGSAGEGILPEEQYLPREYDFMTILPRQDGDVTNLNGAIFYDNAKPKHFKTQLFVQNACHNLFNSEWSSEVPPDSVLSREDHERILTTYSLAFFRAILKRENTLPYLTRHRIPRNVRADKVELSFEFTDSFTIDNHEDNNTIMLNSLNLPNQYNIPVEEHLLKYNNSDFPGSIFVGYSKAMVVGLQPGTFESKLPGKTDISGKEIWIRVAEATNQTGPINFDLGVQDDAGMHAWINSDEISSIPPGFKVPEGSGPKRVLNTIRYPASCFQCKNKALNIQQIEYVLLRHKVISKSEDIIKLAFDDLQIIQVKSGLGMTSDLPIDSHHNNISFEGGKV